MNALQFATKLEGTDCCVCGITFGVPAALLQKRRETGGDFYCPNGHILVFRETEVAKLKKELEAVRQKAVAEQTRAERAERQRDRTSSELKRTKKRIAAGVCPCCKRHFTNLERHMGTKHPGYEQQDIPHTE